MLAKTGLLPKSCAEQQRTHIQRERELVTGSFHNNVIMSKHMVFGQKNKNTPDLYGPILLYSILYEVKGLVQHFGKNTELLS